MENQRLLEREFYKEEIPEWISSHSNVYRGMIDDDDQSPFLLEQKYVGPLDLSSIQNFKKVIEIINYWDITPIPNVIFSYIHENRVESLNALYDLGNTATGKELLNTVITSDYMLTSDVNFTDTENENGIVSIMNVSLKIYFLGNFLYCLNVSIEYMHQDTFDMRFDELIYSIENDDENTYIMESIFDHFITINKEWMYKDGKLSFLTKSYLENSETILEIITIPVTVYNKNLILKSLKYVHSMWDEFVNMENDMDEDL